MDEPTPMPVPTKKPTAPRAPQGEPAFRKALRRAVGYCGSLGALSRASGGKISKGQLAHLLKDTPRISVRWATIIEKATGGAINRVEFFPDIFRDNEKGLDVARKLVRSK